MSVDAHRQEIEQGQRFGFGDNWRRFLQVLNPERIAEAERTLKEMLAVEDLQGKRFLDIGSGSGLFSLAARRLGARVRSFDYDPQSVACTQALRQEHYPADPEWVVGEGSVLDAEFIASLGQFDVVYAWGVLHHTGAMWQALENAALPVAPDGKLFVAIYNDQGRATKLWTAVKHAYNRMPRQLRFLVLGPAFVRLWGTTMLRDLLVGKPFHTWREYGRTSRGMSPWRDVVDWVGGLPFEAAKPDRIFNFFRDRGFSLAQLRTCSGHGCNEFVFVRR